MKYTPKELKDNVNISQTSPIKEFFILLGSLLGLVLIIYITLGFTIDLAADNLPFEVEQKLGSFYSSFYENTAETPAGMSLQYMLDELVINIPDDSLLHRQHVKYDVHLIPGSMVNALALPGGNIIVFSGLVKETESENELAFILAHELGHYAKRDHLRGLGRSLVLLTASAALFGTDSYVTNFLMNSLLTVEMKFSQHQETAADLWALDLINTRYGNVAGATDFFKKLSEKETESRISYYFATHPYPLNRIAVLNEQISQKGYVIKEKVPLEKVFNDIQ